MLDRNQTGRPAGLCGWLVRRVAPDGADATGTEARTALGEIQGYVSIGVSILLSATKGILGMVSGSVSLLADAVNNLADVGSSLIIAASFRMSRKPRDREHPFGHGRVETVATLILALFLIGVALEVARNGIHRLVHPEPVAAPWWLTATIVATVLLKGWLAGFTRGLAKATGSQTLEADAWNHFFDIASSALVVLALVGTRVGWQRVDGYAAVGVSLFIAYTGVRYVREAVDTLIGTAPSEEDLARLRALAATVPGVKAAHDVIVHTYGDVRMMSLHIEVDAALSVLDAHAMAEEVERRIAQAEGAKAIVHVDPVDRRHPAYDAAEALLKGIAGEHPEIVGFHDLRIAGDGGHYDLAVDLVVRADVPRGQFGAVLADARGRLQQALPGCGRVDLGVETEYASEHEHRRVFHLRERSP